MSNEVSRIYNSQDIDWFIEIQNSRHLKKDTNLISPPRKFKEYDCPIKVFIKSTLQEIIRTFCLQKTSGIMK